MARQKLERFATNTDLKNIIEEGKEIYQTIKGNWATFFENSNPIVLEIGCGKGDYTTGMAALFPDKNFVGTDIKGDRIWKGSTVAIENNLSNVAFLRTEIYILEQFFAPCEISDIWITFPDPRPRTKDEKHRLTSERFIDIYKKILAPNGCIHFKTDSDFLYEHTLDLLKNSQTIAAKNLLFTTDVYQSDLLADHHGLTTTYERRYLSEGKKIKYLKFNI